MGAAACRGAQPGRPGCSPLGTVGRPLMPKHLTAELVGRYRDERPALSALARHADTSSLTAIANDYGYDPADPRPVLGGSADPVRRGRPSWSA